MSERRTTAVPRSASPGGLKRSPVSGSKFVCRAHRSTQMRRPKGRRLAPSVVTHFTHNATPGNGAAVPRNAPPGGLKPGPVSGSKFAYRAHRSTQMCRPKGIFRRAKGAGERHASTELSCETTPITPSRSKVGSVLSISKSSVSPKRFAFRRRR